VAIPTKYIEPHGSADCVDGFPREVKPTDKMHIIILRAIVGPVQLERENSASHTIDRIWLVYNYVDLDTYGSVY